MCEWVNERQINITLLSCLQTADYQNTKILLAHQYQYHKRTAHTYHCYTTIKDRYKPLSCPAFGETDHTSILMPKKSTVNCHNDYCPINLTSVVIKCFVQLVNKHITSSLPAHLDSLQFAYKSNRSTDDIIALTPHTTLSHLDKGNTYMQMPFIN